VLLGHDLERLDDDHNRQDQNYCGDDTASNHLILTRLMADSAARV